MDQGPNERLAAAVRASGLVPADSRGVALLSGGPDSACLAAGLVAVAGPGGVTGLHLNYRLRPDSGEDEATVGRLCESLGIELVVERPGLAPGNVQAAARDARYAAAERLRAERGGGWIATGHTRTDQAETLIYRLATSPGSRGLLGLAPRSGRVVRPLLSLGRDETRALAEAAGLPHRDDPSNRDPRFARARIREEVLPVLRELSPQAERNIAATWRQLREESEALERLAVELTGGPVAAIDGTTLAAAHPAVARLALRALAERAAGRPVPLNPGRAAEIVRLASTAEGGEVDLGGGVSAVCEAGHVRVRIGADAAPQPAVLRVPGACRFGHWALRAELRERVAPEGPEVATLDAGALAPALEVRAWRDGDRIRPLGLGGTKTLADLFADARVPRSLRRELPVVISAGTVAWIPGVAVAEDFRLASSGPAVVLTAGRVD
ncbi:MAG TPA: tRNA lysidine(34) synthetase TilS [Solirubrobacterales bacterium]|nr:tRNA lysidine(34) synthetase TilS [Solirubrobacterales bacterium]